MSYQVGNPEKQFSRLAAHISVMKNKNKQNKYTLEHKICPLHEFIPYKSCSTALEVA